jgi:hydroxyacylglutathione hydrolase
MLEIKKFVFGPFSENTFLVTEPVSKESLVLDPGNMDPYENKILLEYIKENNINLKYIVVTHSHIDHLLGVKCLKEEFNSKFLAPEADMPLLMHIEEQAAMFGLAVSPPPKPDEYITTSTELKLGKCKGKFLFTPGHTPGEHCLYFEDEKILFSGDVLFRDSIGRTDLWGGSYHVLLDSISDQLFSLPDDVIVYPGHGDETDIAYEKKNNPYIKDFLPE